MRKKWLMSVLMLVLLLSCLPLSGSKASAADYTQGASLSGATATIWFKSAVSTSWVDVHYKVNNGTQFNYRMTYNSSTARYEQAVSGIPAGTAISYFSHTTMALRHTIQAGLPGRPQAQHQPHRLILRIPSIPSPQPPYLQLQTARCPSK